MIVLDACAAILAFREQREFPENSRLGWIAESDDKIIAPDFFCVEATHVAWKYVHTHVCDDLQAGEMAKSALAYVDEFVDDEPLLAESLSEAIRLDHSVYDMLYFVLARRNGAQLVTCDRKLAKLCEDNSVDCAVLLDM